MKKKYVSKNNFWVGEINKELKVGIEVEYEMESGVLVLNSQTYTAKNLKSAIQAGWLVPVDGKYPKLDGPVGETPDQAADRKRKERFVEQAKQTNEKLVKDQREIGSIKFGGCVHDDLHPTTFAEVLGLDPLPVQKGKYTAEVIQDDTKVVKEGKLFDNKEVKQMKKALNQEPKDKTAPKKLEVCKDQYDAEMKHVGKYVTDNLEQTLGTWVEMHWTKKEDVINRANKELLKELKALKNSEKIMERINKRLETL